VVSFEIAAVILLRPRTVREIPACSVSELWFSSREGPEHTLGQLFGSLSSMVALIGSPMDINEKGKQARATNNERNEPA
jgi:hypothetical protein